MLPAKTERAAFLMDFGVDLAPKTKSTRIFCRACLDWSERRHHIAGFIGVEILRRCMALGWLTRERDSRALTLTTAGRAGLRKTFGIDFDTAAPAKAARLTA
jgi:hypothetical protein